MIAWSLQLRSFCSVHIVGENAKKKETLKKLEAVTLTTVECTYSLCGYINVGWNDSHADSTHVYRLFF